MTLNDIFRRLESIDLEAQSLISDAGFSSDDGLGLSVCLDPEDPNDAYMQDEAEQLLEPFESFMKNSAISGIHSVENTASNICRMAGLVSMMKKDTGIPSTAARNSRPKSGTASAGCAGYVQGLSMMVKISTSLAVPVCLSTISPSA